MNTRFTNTLLSLIAVLLSVNLLAKTDLMSSASAQEKSVTHEVLRARLIELVAPDGKIVAQLHTSEDGAANLRMRDGKGEVRVKLGATSRGSGLILMNRNTEPAVSLAAADDEASLTLARPGTPVRVVRP